MIGMFPVQIPRQAHTEEVYNRTLKLQNTVPRFLSRGGHWTTFKDTPDLKTLTNRTNMSSIARIFAMWKKCTWMSINCTFSVSRIAPVLSAGYCAKRVISSDQYKHLTKYIGLEVVKTYGMLNKKIFLTVVISVKLPSESGDKIMRKKKLSLHVKGEWKH